MKSSEFLVILITACTVVGATKWGIEEERDVIVLDSSNFDNFIKRNHAVFVKFYAPWCTHCVAMVDDYSSLAIRMKEDSEGIPVAQVNADAEIELGKNQKIENYPTLRLFINGEHVDYQGIHSHSAMWDWIKKKMEMKVHQLKTIDEVKKVEEEKRIAVVLLTPSKMNYQLQNFESAALKFDDIPFYYSDDSDIRKHYEVESGFAIAIFRQFNDGRKFLTSKNVISEESIKSFVDSHRLPWIIPLSSDLVHEIFNDERTSVFVFSRGDVSQEYQKALEQLARKYQSEIIFSLVDPTSELGGRLWKFLDIPDNIKDPARLIFFERGALLKFKLDNANITSLGQFIEDFKGAKLKPYYKTEDPPVTEDEGLIKTAVGTTFDEVVIDNDKNVLVIGYSKLSQESLDLLKDLEYLAIELSKFDDIFIVKFNLDANEHPMLLASGHPVIKLFKASTKSSPAEMTMDKSFDAIVEFLEKHLARTIINKAEIEAAEKTPEERGDVQIGTGEDLIDNDL
jgi:protein disulfide-isomerase A1